MKGDFSRFTFDRRKHYTGVRLQQGRVRLDADWNEQLDIAGYLRRALAQDLIGASGAPTHGGGFEIQVNDNRLVISPGRYWVDGILCENDAAAGLLIKDQPDLPGVEPPNEPGEYLAYLDVWEREVTALEDPDLLELALGGPDTTTRTRTVWQVRLIRTAGTAPADIPFLPASLAPPSLTLAVRTRRPPEENQLYRVEIHTPGTLGTATFKWSRDNGSVAALIQRPGDDPANPNKLVIDKQIQGGGFETGQWIEVTDETKLFQGQPGVLAQLATVSGQELTVVGWPGGGGAPELSEKPVIRRWDSSFAGGEPVVLRPTANDGFLALEEGLEVRFGGPPGASLRSGDYWTIPVRVGAEAPWPQTGGSPAEKPPDGIEHHYAPLALLTLAGGVWSRGSQYRKTFEPSVTGIGQPKVSLSGDTMTGSLTINANLTVSNNVTFGGTSPDPKKLTLLNMPLELATGDSKGIRFPALATPAASQPEHTAFLYFSGEAIPHSPQVSSTRLVLGVEGTLGSIVLRAGGQDALTVHNGKVGIGDPPDSQKKLYVKGGALFRFAPPATEGVVIESSLTLKDGTQGDGRFLVSDRNGRATWKETPLNIGAPVFLPQRLSVGNGAAPTGWIRYALSSSKVPAGIRAVILDAEGAKLGPDSGAIDAYILIRRGPDEPGHILMRGRAAGAGDVNAWGNQGMFPVNNDNSFEYIITGSGFDGGWAMNVLGYFP